MYKSMAFGIINHIKSFIEGNVPEKTKPNNIVITGVPRSGTTLCCYLLSQLPNVVALNESMRVGKLRTTETAIKGVEDFFAHTRHTLINDGYATARATKKGLTDNNFSLVNGERELVVEKQRVRIDKNLNTNFDLAIKHNAFFTILLGSLIELYPTFAIIRNPLSILGSWNSVNIPAKRGEVRAAKWLAPNLIEQLEKIPNKYDKQIHILDWYFTQYLSLPEKQVLKYEELIHSNGHALKVITPKATKLNLQLESKNKSKLYNDDLMKRLVEKLLKSDHAYWSFYERSDVEKIIE
jgi:ribosome-associated protein YbcJ (S4-like RNA binding protein)